MPLSVTLVHLALAAVATLVLAWQPRHWRRTGLLAIIVSATALAATWDNRDAGAALSAGQDPAVTAGTAALVRALPLVALALLIVDAVMWLVSLKPVESLGAFFVTRTITALSTVLGLVAVVSTARAAVGLFG